MTYKYAAIFEDGSVGIIESTEAEMIEHTLTIAERSNWSLVALVRLDAVARNKKEMQ